MISVRIKRKKPKGFENVEDLIQLRSPKTRDLFGLDFTAGNMNESTAKLIARCSSLTFEEVSDLDSAEFLKLQTVIAKFVSPS